MLERDHFKLCPEGLFSKCLELWGFFAEDGADEVVRSGIDGIVAIFVFWGDRIGFAFELGIKASHDAIQEGLFLGCEGCLVAEGIDEFLSKMGGISKGLSVGSFAFSYGCGGIVTRARLVGFEATNSGNITIEIFEVFLAFYDGMFFASCTDHGYDTGGMLNFCHML